MITRFRVVLAVAALALAGAVLAAGIGAATTSKKTTVALRKTSLGRVLVDSRGRTLYLFEADKGKTSVCYGQCAQYWPPLLVKGKATLGPGLKRSLVGVTMRKGGAHQLTYGGHPLYLFVKDARAGQTTGQRVDGFGGEWYVVAASGRKIEHARAGDSAGATTPAGTTTTDKSGYGY
jgi:predicted lipoprotein with Yx(FWY)xxD motif